MTQKEPFRQVAKRLATAMMLLSVLGAAGCMTSHRVVASAADDVASMADRHIDAADQAMLKCQEFACEP